MAKINKRGQVVVRSTRTLHRYVISEQIGSGGFGEVFRARLVDLNIPVALKRFRTKRSTAHAALDSWFTEYKTHEALSHPNILQSYDAFEDDGYLYLATELASGSLDRYIQDPATPFLPWDDAGIARAGMHVASALHYLHVGWRDGQPLIHRDVTPANVFFFQESNVFKLGDFGISRLLQHEKDIAVTQIANWGFVAPELIRLGYTVPQSDLFQLGLVLYAMAAGEYVVPQDAPLDRKKQAIATGVAWKAADRLTDTDDGLKKCIKRLLIRDLTKRYQTAAEAHDELSRIYRLLR